MSDPTPESVLRHIAGLLPSFGTRFALVGGLAVSIRAEVRFTRDVDLAVVIGTDRELEGLVFSLRACGYAPAALVEHTERKRLATVRLASASGVVVDLLAASSGIEAEIVERATLLPFPGAGDILVARPEELLATKILSMSDRRLQDRIDAVNLLAFNPQLDLDAVRANLDLITSRGFHRSQDLSAKLIDVLREIEAP